MAEYMGCPPEPRNKAQEHSHGAARCNRRLKEASMAEDREKISTGPNEEPINETIAGTGPGIPDDALAPGEELPEPPSDEAGRGNGRKARRSHRRTRHASAGR